jgi:hypothetical protein
VGPAEENAACVAEFKGAAHGTGPLRGVVRVAQLTGAPRCVSLACVLRAALRRHRRIIPANPQLTWHGVTWR